MALHNIDDQLWFGKYKGVTFEWVMRNDPGYIAWCLKSGALKQNELPTEATERHETYEIEREAFEDDVAKFWGSDSLPYSTSSVIQE